jgi:serine/threonine protein kinase
VKGIVHRDLKSNIMITDDDRVKIVDFVVLLQF